jgi:hypothetical protein
MLGKRPPEPPASHKQALIQGHVLATPSRLPLIPRDEVVPEPRLDRTRAGFSSHRSVECGLGTRLGYGASVVFRS